MIQFGNGFTWSDVYNMPKRWRDFYFNKLVELKKKEQKQVEQTKRKSKVRVK